ncbi:MAG: hypothetical protein ACXVDJ_01840 [Tumebacillaceae bacterium]
MNNRRFFATLLVGALLGSSVLLVMRGHDLDLLYLELARTKDKLQQVQEENDTLTQNLTKAQKDLKRRLHKVVVEVDSAPDEFVKLSVQKKVKLLMQPLMEKDLSLLEEQPRVILSMLDNHSVELNNGSTVKLDVKSVFIGETTTIFLDVEKESHTLNPVGNTETP